MVAGAVLVAVLGNVVAVELAVVLGIKVGILELAVAAVVLLVAVDSWPWSR